MEELKLWEVWVEGYAATGEHGTAHKLGEYLAKSFDDAVGMYNGEAERSNGKKSIAEWNTPNGYMSLEHYHNRRSNWNIWACSLFPTESEARKSFG